MQLAELLAPWFKSPLPPIEIFGLANDSRKVQKGDLFIAYPGSHSDGRAYVKQALQQGASAILYEPPYEFVLESDVPLVAIPDLSKGLAQIASRFYQAPSKELFITGVTGTNGKTTIAWMLAEATELLGLPSAYIGTLGQGRINRITPTGNTTPDALLLQQLLANYVKLGVQSVGMEVSSHGLIQGRVDEILFKQAIFTNLSHEHLDYHHTMEAYAEAKARLFQTRGLETAILNQDDGYSEFMASYLPKGSQKITYGLSTEADVRAEGIQFNLDGTRFTLRSPWGDFLVVLNLVGRFNVYNALAVLASLINRGIPPEKAISVMPQIKAVPGRMELVSKKPYVMVDYAHTPDALEAALTVLNEFKKGRVIVVFGCGGNRDKAKRPMMGAVAVAHADVIVVTSDNPRDEDPQQILNEITANLKTSKCLLQEIDRTKAIQKAIALAEENDLILIAGKGHEQYQEIGQHKHPYSDQAYIQNLLS